MRDKPVASLEELISKAKLILQRSPRILFFVGAGLSQASGIKTFRDDDGYYQDHRVEELAHIDSFFRQRKVMLDWYQARRAQLSQVQPNEGHRAMARMAQDKEVCVATQNVDDLLERAQKEVGLDCEVWHLHGSIADVLCHQCGHVFWDASFDLCDGVSCEKCGGPLRPGVVWFGESLPPIPLQKSLEAAQACDVCVMVGTSGVVYPAAMIPEQALASGATLIEVNPAPSALSSKCEIVLRGKAHEILPRLL